LDKILGAFERSDYEQTKEEIQTSVLEWLQELQDTGPLPPELALPDADGCKMM
jgi:hypothetical protein